MMANHLDFSDFASRGNPGMAQGIECVGLQGLLADFQLALQVVPFLIGEADQGLMVPQAMSFWGHGLIHFAPSSFDLRSNFFGVQRGAKPPCKFPGRAMRGALTVPGKPSGWPERSEWLSRRRNLPATYSSSGFRALPG